MPERGRRETGIKTTKEIAFGESHPLHTWANSFISKRQGFPQPTWKFSKKEVGGQKEGQRGEKGLVSVQR